MSVVSEFTLQPGVVLAGKYRVEGVLGQGGMGIVAAVHHIQLEQRMALKLMLPHAMASSEAISRFLREARAAARITSEHVARVFDVGALETGEPYIAMEYLEGSDISQLLAAQGRLSPQDALDYLLQACEALAEAHVAGIVHRDLKPGNLFLARRLDGQRLVKVLDFGISKMSGAAFQSNAPATHTSALMGSPLYMSPEQMSSSKAVDARSDIWALGVVLYEMLSGGPPFQGETLPQVCGMVMNEDPPPLRERAPGLPEQLYAVVARTLLKQPAARFQSIAELAQALEPMASPRARQSVERILRVQGVTPSVQPLSQGMGVVAAAVTGSTGSTSQPSGSTYAPWGETKPPVAAKRSAAPLALAALGLMGLAGGGVWFARRSLHSEPTAEAPASASSPATASGAPARQTDPAPSVTPVVVPLPSGPASAIPSVSSASQPPAPAPPVVAHRALAPRPGANPPSPEAAKPPTAKPVAAAPSPAPTPAAPPPVSTRSRL